MYQSESLKGHKKLEDAVQYYKNSLSQKDSCNSLGIIQEDHYKDINLAIEYFCMARELKHPESGLNLASLIKYNLSELQNVSFRLPGVDSIVSESTIFELMKESLCLGSFSAKIELAKLDYKPTPEERKQSDQWYDDPVEFLRELQNKP